jgi:PAS domain S-box-containing protein
MSLPKASSKTTPPEQPRASQPHQYAQFTAEDPSLLARLAAIVESSDDAIVSKSLDGQIQTWNAGATRIFGYTAEEAIGKAITLIIPPELHAEERQILQRVRNGERIDHFDTIRVTKDGRRIHISLTVSPILDARGVVIGASKTARDITERKRSELLLQESQRYMSMEAEALTRLNERGSRLWRASSQQEGLDEMLAAVMELLGADMGNVQLHKGGVLKIEAYTGFGPELLELFQEESATDDSACARSLKSGERVIIEDVTTDPRVEPLRAAARAAGFRAAISTPLVGGNGTLLGVLSIHFKSARHPSEQDLRRLDLYTRQASDFIQRFNMEQALRQSEEALREADQRKNEFLALLAHELRNPLAPIRYAVALGKRLGRTPEQQQRADEIIERQVEHMSRLLDDLLDVSRITRGAIELKKSRVELTSVVASAIEAVRPLLDTKRHSLTLDLPKEPLRLETDPVRLAQILSNLLINAAKYTDPNGQIELRARREGTQIVIGVRDNGIGISAEMLPRLFTLFSQARPALDRSEGGLGIGLALVRGLVGLHGGKVEARSEGSNRGSEFIVRLPIGAESPAADAKPPEDRCSSGAALQLLLADDNRDAAETCAMLLESEGHRVYQAHNGQQALELAERYRPDALLLDIGMPDMNGYQLAQQIRSVEWGKQMLLIAVTGWGQADDKRRAREAGFDHHLVKPIDIQQLRTLLAAS